MKRGMNMILKAVVLPLRTAAGVRGLTLRELSGKYARRFDQEYSRRTFNNHRAAVEDLFGVSVECDRRTNRYSIPFGSDVMDNDQSIGWHLRHL